LTAPSAVAIDIGGNAWIANSGGNTVSVYTPSGGTYSGSPFSGGGMINAPVSIAIDASGNIWIANTGNSTLTELNSAGTYIAAPVSQGTGSTATISSPKSLAIDPK
jgi:DNA-binding beta-propeller fold protein YncE